MENTLNLCFYHVILINGIHLLYIVEYNVPPLCGPEGLQCRGFCEDPDNGVCGCPEGYQVKDEVLCTGQYTKSFSKIGLNKDERDA